tara:strand:- start:42367 stop:42963 length:597 start_codon:yes stop_codon:yes gene_type:complete
MWNDNWLTRKWNAIKENRRIAAHHEEQRLCVYGAIAAKDSELISTTLKNTERPERFINWNLSGFLSKSLEADDVAVFRVFLDYVEKPLEYRFAYNGDGGPDSGYSYSCTPLLNKAIEMKAENIALYIARQPGAHIAEKSYSSYTSYDDGKTNKSESYGDKPSDLAEKQGMEKLSAELLRAEANALKAKAFSMEHKLLS